MGSKVSNQLFFFIPYITSTFIGVQELPIPGPVQVLEFSPACLFISPTLAFEL